MTVLAFSRDASNFQDVPTDIRSMMEGRVFGLREWQTFYGAGISSSSLYQAGEFPWSVKDLLVPCPFNSEAVVAETHVVFLGVSRFEGDLLTILKLDELEGRLSRCLIQGPRFVRRHNFANRQTCRNRWYLMPASCALTNLNRGRLSLRHRQHHARYAKENGYRLPLAVEEVMRRVLFRSLALDEAPSTDPCWSYSRSNAHEHPVVVAGNIRSPHVFVGSYPKDVTHRLIGFSAIRTNS